MLLGSGDRTGHTDNVPTCRTCDETIILTHTVAKYVVGSLARNNVSAAIRFIHLIKSLWSNLAFISQQIKKHSETTKITSKK